APVRLSGAAWLVLGALLGLVIVVATDQVVPATSAYQAQMRVWLAARATGIAAYVLLTTEVLFGLLLSHPTNQSTWQLSRRIFPWHENLLVFTGAFLGAHVVALLLDPWAGVGIAGAFIPGLSAYRSAPVALGTLALYAMLVTGITARWTRLLPRGLWLRLHRLAAVAWVLAWIHGLLAGTDSAALLPMYLATGAAVLMAIAYRYWAARKGRPTFSTSLPERGTATAGASRGARVRTVPVELPAHMEESA
ncbi:MAG: Ferric reductase domain protein transrane component domain protein, partial [Chloroflexi bacterium]|nr:Ferric reductase domain protein transrane component domain protein [Chloroflexota bacterium]